MTRDEKIYELTIKKEYPVPVIARLAGMSRQNVHRIIDAQIAVHGGEKPQYTYLLSACDIDAEIAAMFAAERERLGLKSSQVVRIAINQAIEDDLDIDTGVEPMERVGRTPSIYITARQHGYMSAHENKTQALQQVLRAYQPIEIEL